MDKLAKHRAVCMTLTQMYADKNHDYGDSFGETFKDSGIISAVTRIVDKTNRIKTLCTKEQKVKGESIKDNLKDLANYCIMTLIEMDDEK